MADYRNVDTKQKDGGTRRRDLTAAQKAAVAIVGDIADQLDPKLLTTLHDAMLNPSAQEGRAAVRKAMMAGVRGEDIADFYIPTLARAYGDQWTADELTFGEVTIAVSRLQTVLRDLEVSWPRANDVQSTSATLMLVIPKDVFHTLGAFVLSGQLRRKGISVKMVLGGTSKTVTNELSASKYDAIFISASHSDTLGSLRLIIDAVKAATEDAPPVVIGGTILDVESAETVMAETGATYATGHAEEALRHCGLLLTKQDDAPTKYRG